MFGLGVTWSGIISFLTENWLTLLSVILATAGLVLTPYYIRGRISSAREERYSQAKTLLLDVLENILISDREITRDGIKNIREAIDRRHNVSLGGRLSTIDILQDLQLRVEESKLDVDDKKKYSEEIIEMINSIQEDQRIEDLPIEYQQAIEQLDQRDEVSASDVVKELEQARSDRSQEELTPTLTAIQILFNPSKMNELPTESRRRALVVISLTLMIYLAVVLSVTLDII